MFDTADVYGFGQAERLLGKAIRACGEKPENLLISTKGGVAWDSKGKTRRDSSPKHLRKAVHASLKRLKIESIPLYFLHWPDGITPLEESLLELQKLCRLGYIQAVGISNVSIACCLRCREFSVSALQVKGNLLEPEELIKYRKISKIWEVPIISFSSLADGLLSGAISPAQKFQSDDHRNRYPLFQKRAKMTVVKRINILKLMAENLKRSPAQFALRWLLDSNLASGVLFGAKNPRQSKDNLGALGWKIPKKKILEGRRIVYRNHLAKLEKILHKDETL